MRDPDRHLPAAIRRVVARRADAHLDAPVNALAEAPVHAPVDLPVAGRLDARRFAPRSASHLAPSPLQPVSPPRLPTVLVVDHDAAARAALAHMLHLFGHVAVGAADGEEALALAARYAGSLTLLVADVDLLGIGGPTLARAVGSRLPGLPVLFVSGERAPRHLSDAVVGQPAAFLAKPLTADALKRALAELTS